MQQYYSGLIALSAEKSNGGHDYWASKTERGSRDT
jgi:hypothetical protein